MSRGCRSAGRALVLAPVLLLAGCGSSATPAATTSTTSPASLAAGKEVCQGFFEDLEILPRLERAQEAGPQLGRIFAELADLRARQDAGELSGEALLERVRRVVASLEIVCEDDFGVPPPPGYTTRTTTPG